MTNSTHSDTPAAAGDNPAADNPPVTINGDQHHHHHHHLGINNNFSPPPPPSTTTRRNNNNIISNGVNKSVFVSSTASGGAGVGACGGDLINSNSSNNGGGCTVDGGTISSSSSTSSTTSYSTSCVVGVGPSPFIGVAGEKTDYSTHTSEGGLLLLTNYRLFVCGGRPAPGESKTILESPQRAAYLNLPLGLLEAVEVRDIFYLHVYCKDARSNRITFSNNENALEVYKRLQPAISPYSSTHKPIQNNFAFNFHQRILEQQASTSSSSTTNTSVVDSSSVKLQLGIDLPKFPNQKERFLAEIKRMEFNIEGPWRVSDENEGYELCASYPNHIIVPSGMTKAKLKQSATFRSAERFPAVVWRHRGNGAVISRCSQPEVGWFGWRSTEDEELVQYIVLACAENARSLITESISITTAKESSPGGSSLPSMEFLNESPYVKKLLILDARSYTTAVANRARGGGCECLEYYPHCEIQFMNLANIHSIRKSFTNVRQLCSLPPDQANWYSQLEGCKWLQHMSGLMKAALQVVTAIENDARPVMVHCSDGWDRTPQIVALAEILLDSYYRSLEGFQILVEREWLDFGHKFGDRCGQGVGTDDSNEKCPVFLQWLDCLHQLLTQFPSAFEFNQSFLVKLAQHTYSNLFGTFLCNTAKERDEYQIVEKTHSVWRFLRAPANYDKFRNNLYINCDKVLWPNCEVRDLSLWAAVYLGNEKPLPLLTEVVNPSQESSPAPSVSADSEELLNEPPRPQMRKTLSCEDLAHHHLPGGMTRRLSDPEMNCSYSSDAMGCSCDLDSAMLSSIITNHNHDEMIQMTTTTTTANSTNYNENEKNKTCSSSSELPLLSSNPSNASCTISSASASCSIHECCNSSSSGDVAVEEEMATAGKLAKIIGDNEESENEEEEEENDTTDPKYPTHSSSATLSNFRQVDMKSIESSTDTLVAELGILTDTTTTATTTTRSSTSTFQNVKGNDINKTDETTGNQKNQQQQQDLNQPSSSTKINSCLITTQPPPLLEQIYRSPATTTATTATTTSNFVVGSDGENHYPLENLCFTSDEVKQQHLYHHHQDLSSSNINIVNNVVGIGGLNGGGGGGNCEVCRTSRKILNGLSSSATVVLHTTTTTTTNTTTNNSDNNNGTNNSNNNNYTTTSSSGSKIHSRTSSIGLGLGGCSSSSSNNNNIQLNGGGVQVQDESHHLLDGGGGVQYVQKQQQPPHHKSDNKYYLMGSDQQQQQQNNGVVKIPFDVDGLTPLHDEVQLRLNSIISVFQSQVDSLQRELYVTRLALMKQVSHRCAHHHHFGAPLEDLGCLPESESGGVGCSSGGDVNCGADSGSSTELSWEAVEERETRPPLWVPDYAVNRCMRCSANFWMGKRKHHCRSCGKIFCAECSENKIPIPNEQIFNPVRVCVGCFNRRGAAELLPPDDTLLEIHSLLSANNTDESDQEQSSSPPKQQQQPQQSYASVVQQQQQQSESTTTTNLLKVKEEGGGVGGGLSNGHHHSQ